MSSEDLVREAQDPSTTPGRLAELAQADRATWAAIVFNPSAYDGLLQWLGERGDPTVNAALAARASYAAAQAPQAPPAPAAPPAPVAPAAPVAPVVPVVPAEPVEEAAPVAEPVAPVEPVSPVAEPVVPVAEDPFTAPAAEQAPEPTVSLPQQPQAPEPTAQIPQQSWTPEPTAVQPAAPQPAPVFPAQPTYEAPAATTSAFGSVPPGGKPLGIVIAMVAVILLLIGGAAFGATKVFGGDDDKPTITSGDSKTTDAPDSDDSDDDEPTPSATPTVPTLPSPDAGGAKPAGAFCTELNDIQSKSMNMLGNGSSTDVEGLQDTARELVKSYQDLEDIAPADIKGDIGIMSSFLSSMMNPTSGEAPTGMDQYMQAAQRIGVYYAQNCL